ncbi:hypothetical protein HAV15_007808 [Penicillium sp. str. |nr:hypothetical protein HAV15_007808 [Penicillium sp. str. \
MTMVMENQNRPYGGMSFDNVYHHTPPQFTDPWAAHTSSHSTPPVYATSMGNGASMGLGQVKQEEVNRTGMSMPYPNIPVSAPSMVAGSTYAAASYGPEVMGMQHEVPRTTFDQAPSYTTAPPMSSFAPSSYAYAPIHPSPQDARRISHSDAARVGSSASAPTFGDALDASRGMVALSQDLTPRNIYGPGPRGTRTSADSYGFPSTQSSASSISSGGNYPYYSASVVPPPGPQSMMSQFSSKMPSNTQKKHKCKVCDKRFTRPSSLQTHMYSHTGEKPFACDVEGCGRHFSVVSNLRRHKKVHKGEKDTGSGDDDE